MLTPSNPLITRFISTEVLLNEGCEDLVMASLTKGYAVIEEKGLSLTASTSDDGYWPEEDSWEAEFRPYSVVDGILRIPVEGVLINNFDCTVWGMITGYQYVDRAFQRGMADPDVKGIALVINSPGGEVSGNFDLVDKMFLSRQGKPVAAFANEHAYSAAYSIATVAEPGSLSMTRTGGVGSIGVVTSHVDASKYYERMGRKITYIHAGKHKVDGNSTEPLSKETKDRIQARVDSLMSIFVATVARNRGLSEEAVRKTEALTYGAEEAVALGLADKVQPFEDAVAAFAASITPKGEKAMATKPADSVAEQVADNAAAASVETARQEGYAEGVKAERTRIEAILGCEQAAQRPKMSNHLAFKAAMSVEDAQAMLAVAGVEVVETPAAESTQTAGVPAEIFNAAMTASAPNVGSGDQAKEASDDKDSAEYALKMARAYGVSGLTEEK